MYPSWPSQELLYVPCWDKECEALHCSFLRAPVGTDSDRAASSLHSRLDQKRQERWEEAVSSIDFSHSSSKVWSTINKLTSRSGPWSSEGGQGRALTPCILNFFYFSIAFSAKKGRFLSFEKEKWKIHHFWTPPWKNVDAFRWKNPLMGPHLETIPPTAMVWTLVISVPRFSKMHRFTTREELGTQEEEVRVHKARLQEGVRHMEGRNTWRR